MLFQPLFCGLTRLRPLNSANLNILGTPSWFISVLNSIECTYIHTENLHINYPKTEGLFKLKSRKIVLCADLKQV